MKQFGFTKRKKKIDIVLETFASSTFFIMSQTNYLLARRKLCEIQMEKNQVGVKEMLELINSSPYKQAEENFKHSHEVMSIIGREIGCVFPSQIVLTLQFTLFQIIYSIMRECLPSDPKEEGQYIFPSTCLFKNKTKKKNNKKKMYQFLIDPNS